MNENEDVQRNLGLATHWLEVGRPEKCLEVTAQAPAGATELPRLYAVRAAALLELDRSGEASRVAQEGLAIDAEDPWLLELLAIASMRQGHLAKAEGALLDALRLEPKDGILLARYALVVARAGQLEKARALITRARESSPEAPYVGKVASLIAYLEGDDRAALSLGTETLARDPEGTGIHALMGAYLLERGDIGRATQHHLIAASRSPGDDEVVDLGRHARYLKHPLMRPMWLIERVGPAKVWLGSLAMIVVLNAAGLESLVPFVVIPYLIFIVYTWVVPPLMRRRYGIK